MKNQVFFMRILNLVLVLGLILGYQGVMQIRVQAEENTSLQNQITTLEYSLAKNDLQEDTQGIYKEGTYTARADGFGGSVEVAVTVEAGKISAIEITSAKNEDKAYLTMAMDIVDNMIKSQSADVDTISGATFTSTGIKNAVSKALEQAVE